MARLICPSCGEAFNGKKCKNCEYEVFGDIGNPDLHGRREGPSARGAHGGAHTCAPGQPHTHTNRTYPSGSAPFGGTPVPRKRRKRKRPSAVLVAIILLLFVIPLMNVISGLVLSTARTADRFSGSHWEAVPEPEAIPADSAKVIYSDGGFTVWADWEEHLAEGEIPVVVENHTDQEVNVTARQILLHGNFLSDEGFLYVSVPGGRTAEGTLYLEDADVAGIEHPALVSFCLHIYDAKTYDTILDTAPITLAADNGATPEPVAEPEGTPVAGVDGIRVYYQGLIPGSSGPETLEGSTLNLWLVNDTDLPLSFFTESGQINGQEANLPIWNELPPHTMTCTDIYLHGLEELGVTRKSDVESIQLHLQVSDDSGTLGQYGVIDLEPFTITLD